MRWNNSPSRILCVGIFATIDALDSVDCQAIHEIWQPLPVLIVFSLLSYYVFTALRHEIRDEILPNLSVSFCCDLKFSRQRCFTYSILPFAQDEVAQPEPHQGSETESRAEAGDMIGFGGNHTVVQMDPSVHYSKDEFEYSDKYADDHFEYRLKKSNQTSENLFWLPF